MHCCKCFHVRFCLSYPSLFERTVIKAAPHMWKNTLKKRILNIQTPFVHPTEDRSEHTFAATVSGFLHSSPDFPLTPPPPTFSLTSHFSQLLCPQRCSVEDLVTPLMTAAVRLCYQFNSVDDTLSAAEPCCHSPPGNIYLVLQTPPRPIPPPMPPPLPSLL